MRLFYIKKKNASWCFQSGKLIVKVTLKAFYCFSHFILFSRFLYWNEWKNERLNEWMNCAVGKIDRQHNKLTNVAHTPDTNGEKMLLENYYYYYYDCKCIKPEHKMLSINN